MTMGLFGAFIILLFKLYDPVRKFAYFYNASSRPWARQPPSSTSLTRKTM